MENFLGKISSKLTLLCATPIDKTYTIKSIIITNNTTDTDVTLDIFISVNDITYYIAPRNLTLNNKETFVFEGDLFLDKNSFLRAKIISATKEGKILSSCLNILDFIVMANV
jgi:hypothetical protein